MDKCICKDTLNGAADCSKCSDGYYEYDHCKPCSLNCSQAGTKYLENGLVDCGKKDIPQCQCKDAFKGNKLCSKCSQGYYKYPDCEKCGLTCSTEGTKSFGKGLTDCGQDDTPQCQCKDTFKGNEHCSKCSQGYYRYPHCKACDLTCSQNGTKQWENGLIDCGQDNNPQCQCKKNFDGETCHKCKRGYYKFPDCNRKSNI